MKQIKLLLALISAVCILAGCVQGNTGVTADTSGTDPVSAQTSVNAATQEQTDNITTSTPEEKVYKMADFTFTQSEKEASGVFASAQSGLLATYFMDEAGQKQISVRTVDGKTIEIDDSRIVRLIKLTGFIRFDSDGRHKLAFSDNVSSTIVIGNGDLHLSIYSGSYKFRAGVYYEFSAELKVKEPSEKITITLGSETGEFELHLCRPLCGGDMPDEASPMLDLPMRDAQIINEGGVYYMTGSFGPDFWDNSYEIHVYKSTDLKVWEDLGAVWNYDNDATWGKKVANDKRRPVWAPEIHCVKGQWYICYSLGFWGSFCGGLLKSTTGLPQGPYVDVTDKKLVDYIDSSIYEDDDGSVYFIYSDGLIAKMNEDMTGFAEKFKSLYAGDGMPVGFEGCYIYKLNGLYYLTSSLYNTYTDEDGKLITSYDCVYAVSDNEGNLYLSHFITWCKPAVTRLATDERGVLSVDYK